MPMKPFADHLGVYAASHRHPRNRLAHYVGVPTIIFALMVLLSLVRLPAGSDAPSLAVALTLAVLAYYRVVEFAIGLALGAVFAVLLWAADRVADLGTGPALAVSAAAFVGGWVVQLIGHRAEGNRPALLTSLFQVVVSPVYLMAELFLALGLGKDLAREIDARIDRHAG
jgi:uncharacterized membrane protein YGL010W